MRTFLGRSHALLSRNRSSCTILYRTLLYTTSPFQLQPTVLQKESTLIIIYLTFSPCHVHHATVAVSNNMAIAKPRPLAYEDASSSFAEALQLASGLSSRPYQHMNVLPTTPVGSPTGTTSGVDLRKAFKCACCRDI